MMMRGEVVGAARDDGGGIGDAWAGILRDDGGGVGVGAAFTACATSGDVGVAKGTRGTEDGEARRVGGLGAEGLDVGGDVAQGVVRPVKARVETRWGA